MGQTTSTPSSPRLTASVIPTDKANPKSETILFSASASVVGDGRASLRGSTPTVDADLSAGAKKGGEMNFRGAYMQKLQSATNEYLKNKQSGTNAEPRKSLLHIEKKEEESPISKPKEIESPTAIQATGSENPETQSIVKEEVVDTFTTEKSEGFELNFISKSVNDIRRNYLMKLAYNKIWLLPGDKPKSHQTAIIFDWDDTLLCTSYLTPTGYVEDIDIPEVAKRHLKNLNAASSAILKKASDRGKTYIITNAAPGWVEYSAQRFMPSVYEILPKVTVISARGGYEAMFPGNCHQWKMHAFLETQKDLESSTITNLVALGDSHIEMDAAHHLATKFSTALIKTVKFRETPTPDELVKQLNLVFEKFDQICDNVKNLTIRLERKQSSPRCDCVRTLNN